MTRARTLLVSVVLVACAPQATPPSTVAPTTTASTSTTVAAVVVERRGCTQAEQAPWSLLCQAYRLVATNHIDAPDPASLAAAATAGVRTATGPPGPPFEECVIPHRAFGSVCEAISERAAAVAVDDLVRGAVQGMFRFGLDPFSAYLGPGDSVASPAGHVLGLGLVVAARDGSGNGCGPLSELCSLLVVAVLPLSSADRETVLVGDEIVQVDGDPIAGLSEAEAVARLTRAPGTVTTIVIDRAGTGLVKELVHEEVRFGAVEFGMLTPQIAYIRLNDFSQQAAQALGQLLRRPEVEGAAGLVLDLRDNPGGLVLSAQAVASQFLTDGAVLVEETRRGTVVVPVVPGGLGSAATEIVVLVNGGSASAAEVVAAALQSAGRARVVGRPTFGKNLVQDVFAAPDGGEFRISVARWTAPDGTDVGGGGLQPDVLVDLDRDESALLAEVVSLFGG